MAIFRLRKLNVYENAVLAACAAMIIAALYGKSSVAARDQDRSYFIERCRARGDAVVEEWPSDRVRCISKNGAGNDLRAQRN